LAASGWGDLVGPLGRSLPHRREAAPAVNRIAAKVRAHNREMLTPAGDPPRHFRMDV